MLSAVFTDMSRPLPATSRLLALNTLCELQQTGDPVNLIFERLSRECRLDQRDRQLAGALVFGILRARQYLDHIIARFSSHPLAGMRVRTLNALRIGIYQLLCMDRIPPSAAVNETVQAFKAGRQPVWLVRFVNGILRSVARERSTLPTADQLLVNGKPILNHPRWLLEKWEQNFGRERAHAICRTNNRIPPLTLRVNTWLTDQKQLAARLAEISRVERGRFSSTALLLPDYRGDISGLPGYAEGLFMVQDEAAQLAGCLLAMKSGGRYLDGCAGVGGKTTHLAELLPNKATLMAIEPEKRRYCLLQENLCRLQITGVATRHMNLASFAAEAEGLFDGILLDVPCSGTGVIGRRPDIRWNRQPEDMQGLQEQQLQLLTAADSLLAPHGILVYATCSLEDEENSEVIRIFLAGHPDYYLEDAGAFLPSPAKLLVDADGFFQPTPEQGLDGFFAARLRKSCSL